MTVYWRDQSAWLTISAASDGVRAIVQQQDGTSWDHTFTRAGERVTLPYGRGSIEFHAASLGDVPVVRIHLH